MVDVKNVNDIHGVRGVHYFARNVNDVRGVSIHGVCGCTLFCATTPQSQENAAMSEQAVTPELLVRELGQVTQWDILGTYLGLEENEIEEIERDHQHNARRRIAMFSKWFEKDPHASWEKIIDALQCMLKVRLANQLKEKYISCATPLVRRGPLDSSANRELTIDKDERIVREIVALGEELVEKAEAALEAVNPPPRKLKRFLQYYKQPEVQTVEELFDQLNPFYFLEYALLEKMIKYFLKKGEVAENLSDYLKQLANFKSSTTVRDFMNSIEEAQQSRSTAARKEKVCTVTLRLVGGWLEKTMNDLEKLVNELFKEKTYVLSHLKIVRGSIVVTYLSPLSEVDNLIAIAKTTTEHFMIEVGICGLEIGSWNTNFRIPKNVSFGSSLLKAVSDDNIDLIRFLLSINTNPNAVDQNNQTALHVASELNHDKSMILLLQANANSNLQDNKGRTPLYIASLKGHIEIVSLLLESNANPDLQSDNGSTPLFIASQEGHSDIVALLLKNIANPDPQTKDGCTPLYIASENGHTEIVALLLKHNAITDIQTTNGCTPLYIASNNGHTHIVTLLLKNNANLFLQTTAGCTPLYAACENGHSDIVSLLQRRNSNLQTADHIQPVLDHRVLFQKLNRVQWDTLGINLGLSVEEIQEIELDHQTTSRRRSEMLNKWLKKELNPTWLMVVDALEKMSENRLAIRLRNAYVAANPAHTPSRASSEELELTIGRNDKIARAIEDLSDEYFTLIRETESAIKKMNPSLNDLKRFSQFYMGNEVSTVDELFDQLKPFNLLDYPLLQKIVKVFLVAPNTVDDKISDYVKHWETFKTSTTIRQFTESIEQAQQSHSTASERPGLCTVKLRLIGGWMNRTMDDLEKLVKVIFEEKRHVLSHLKIVRGSVIVTFSAPQSEAYSLILVAREHSSFALQVGVSQLVVADTVITQSESLDFSFESSLLEATKDNNLNLLNFLLSINTNSNAADQSNQTALHVASELNHDKSMILLLQANANPNLQDDEGRTPLYIASREGHIQMVAILLQNSANPDLHTVSICTPLYAASYMGHTDIVALLLQNNANPNLQATDGCTPLYVASGKNHTDIVALLLQNNANPDLQATDGCTPLYIASRRNHTDIVALLLKDIAKINKDLPKDNGCTPLFIASQNGHTDVVALLLKNNANPDLQGINGCTPLYIASQNGHTDVVALLLKKKANPDLPRDNGCTPLYVASQNGHTDVVALLLKDSANPDLQEFDGCTPLFIASRRGQTDIIALLLKNNANPDLQEINGCTPLYIASQEGHTDVVSLLLKANANVNLDYNGVTPLGTAIRHSHSNIVDLLVAAGATDTGIQPHTSDLFTVRRKGRSDVLTSFQTANPHL